MRKPLQTVYNPFPLLILVPSRPRYRMALLDLNGRLGDMGWKVRN